MQREEEYDCPGPSGGVMGRYHLACPIHPKASIKVKDTGKRMLSVKLAVKHSALANLNIHVKRRHML